MGFIQIYDECSKRKMANFQTATTWRARAEGLIDPFLYFAGWQTKI